MKKDLFGVGLRPTHFPSLEANPPIHVNWFEAISENFMNTEGRPLEMLLKMRADFPIALHGVALSVGSTDGVREDYLKKLRTLFDRVDPIIVSDHFCFGQIGSINSHDLLPMPLTKNAFVKLLENIERTQNYLGRRILLENISHYLSFKENEIVESEFLIDACKKSGCGLLLDINNVHVNAVNYGFDPIHFLDSIPLEIIGQFHLAGPSQEEGFLFDTHSSPTPPFVWGLYEHMLNRGARAPLIVEWDENIPDFQTLENEVVTAKRIYENVKAKRDTPFQKEVHA